MSDTVNPALSPAQIDYLVAAHVAMGAQDPPEPPAPPMASDRQATANQGSASPSVALDDPIRDPWGSANPGADEPVYQDENGRVYTRREVEEIEAANRLGQKIANYTAGGTNIAIGAATGWRAAVRIRAASAAVNTARTVTTAANATRTATTIGRIATVGKVAARGAGRALPVVGAGFSAFGIYNDISNWNAPGNNNKADDVARIAGDGAIIAGTAMLFTPAAPIGLGVMAAGFIINGIGSLFGD